LLLNNARYIKQVVEQLWTTLSEHLPQKSLRGRPLADAEEKRAVVVEAALRVIQRRGFEGASLRQIAVEAGCTTGVLTHYFTNKDDLIEELTEGMMTAIDQWRREITADQDAFQALRQVLEASVASGERSEAWSLWYQLLLKARMDRVLAKRINGPAQQLNSSLERLVEAAQAQGTIRDDQSAELLVELVVSVAEGWSLMVPVDPERFGAERCQRLVQVVLEGLKPVAHTSAAVLREQQ